MTTVQITQEQAVRVLEVVNAGLVPGLGVPELGKMCVEAAVCFAFGWSHSDTPLCVSKSVRAYKMGLNDASWSSPTARANGLKKLALVQLGTNTDFDDVDFSYRIVMWTVQKLLPKLLRKVLPTATGTIAQCEQCIDLETAARAADAADAADAAHAARAAARAADAAAHAARAADELLVFTAEGVCQILIDMKAYGTRFLDLVK